MKISPGVANCLYMGIHDRINWMMNYVRSRTDDEEMKGYIKENFELLTEALDFYEEYCVLGSGVLRDQYEKLKPEYEAYLSRK